MGTRQSRYTVELRDVVGEVLRRQAFLTAYTREYSERDQQREAGWAISQHAGSSNRRADSSTRRRMRCCYNFRAQGSSGLGIALVEEAAALDRLGSLLLHRATTGAVELCVDTATNDG